MTDHNAFPSVTSGQEATLNKVGPLIKDAAFTSLTEFEIAKMRSFLDPNDTDIADDEVFFLMPQTGGAKDIEGDFRTATPSKDDTNNSYKQPSTAAGKFDGARRMATKDLVEVNGVLTTVTTKVPVRVVWNAVTPSPAGLQIVEVELV